MHAKLYEYFIENEWIIGSLYMKHDNKMDASEKKKFIKLASHVYSRERKKVK